MRASGVERLPALAVPSTVRFWIPGVTVAPTVSVSTEVVPVGAAGSNDPVTPAGALPRLNVTAPVKLVRVILTFAVPVMPWTTVSAAGVSDNA